MSMSAKKIFIVAGDKSGDLYGGLLSQKLKEKFSNIEIYSFGGSSLSRHSHQIENLTSHSVSGIYEVISSVRKFLRLFQHAYEEIMRIRPDLVILIDFPDFNLRLAERINRRIPVFYYVSPQVWAWRQNRVNIIKKYVEKMIVIFKFEVEFYKKMGIDALYFGHPLLEIISAEPSCPKKKIISFMPGSRKNEIKYNLHAMEGAKNIIEKTLKGYSFRIIKADNIDEHFYHRLTSLPLEPHSYKAIAESEFVITSSGTATVEVAVIGIPYLIIYRLNALSWYLLKRMVHTPYVGMVNILSGEKIVEELLQNNATPRNIAEHTLFYLRDKNNYNRFAEKLKKVKELLSPYGATDKFATYIGEYLKMYKK